MDERQISFFDIQEGERLKEVGMQNSSNHAENDYENWNDIAARFVKNYAKHHLVFMGEDVRVQSEATGILKLPKDKRAWGSVMSKAARSGIITRVGYEKVKNPKAHRGYSCLWKSNIFIGPL